MKRIVFILLLLPQLAFSQYRSDAFRLSNTDGVSQIKVESTFNKDTTINLEQKSITGLSLSGTTIMENSDDSYVRVTLVDQYNYEYLVYENYPLLSDKLETEFSNVALETLLLDGITPQHLQISLKNASLRLRTVNYSTDPVEKRKKGKNAFDLQKEQTRYIANKLNENLKKRNMTWRAGVTSMTEKTFAEKKDMFGGTVPELYGFDYYVGGIFVMPSNDQSIMTLNATTSNQFVAEWDWRNRHGKNWMTPVRNQRECGSCWAHSVVAVVEAFVNLYYNCLLDYDLSEQEIITCTQSGCNNGTENRAFTYIKNPGVVNEDCFPYTGTGQDCSNKCPNPDERVFIEDFVEDDYRVEDSLAAVKRALFKRPLTMAVQCWDHSMTAAGYKTISIGDVIYFGSLSKNDSVVINSTQHQGLIGRTAWLLKNSWDTTWGTGGYCYLVFDIGNASWIGYPTGAISCINYDDSDIVISDADGDGLYFWGIGPKPSHCPSWVPDEADGDDSNINYGSLDSYGNLDVLPAGITIKTPVTYASNSSISYRLGIVNGGTLTITGTTTLTGNARIRVCEGGTLVVDGGTIQNADITMVPGSTVILRNGGKINMASGKDFDAPKGVTVNLESGEIQ